jgi:hypothetical protein
MMMADVGPGWFTENARGAPTNVKPMINADAGVHGIPQKWYSFDNLKF